MLTIEDLEKISENKFLMVNLVAKRARELRETRPITEDANSNFVTQAAKEVSMGLITSSAHAEL